MLRPAKIKRGNKLAHAGCIFSSKTYLDHDMLEKGKHYPLELTVKDGILYAKLPSELVPLLR
jgi:hypothetical protein